MKASPLFLALSRKKGVEQKLIHTGQHYDANMSESFLRELQLPAPDLNLEVGSSSHAVQTAEIMVRLEPVIKEGNFDMALVYGDVNSTLAGAIVCSKLGVPLAHVEAGLRSNDRTMPEEINRLVTDRLADLLFTPSRDADANLLREGVDPGRVHFVGNVMIDSLVRFRPIIQQRQNGANRRPFVLVTLHRPSNVDDLPWLRQTLEALSEFSSVCDVLFPVHPRTKKRMLEAGISDKRLPLTLCDPLSYFEFMALMMQARAVVTDSGGIQEETTFLGIPCLTMRENTERPVTVQYGTNTLVGRDVDNLRAELVSISTGRQKRGAIPELWDGNAAVRIADVITQ